MANETNKQENTVVYLITPGDILDDRWLIETRIGQGAMGSVFQGRDTQQNKPVAIKILAPEHCRKPKVLARFEREARLMTTLRHPNIIQISGVGRRGALPYIVMQYLEGMTLYDVLKHKGGKLTAGETMAVVKQISAGLSFIHHHGLVHRDVKPQNIFVGPGGHVTILDLGVVRDKSKPGLTKPGAMVGTPYYMSPEQITGTEEIDKRTDVYALAAMTFELLVGRPPFQGANNFEVLYAHRHQPAPDASLVTKNVSQHAASALMRGMAKSREERPQSATEFYADLEAFFGQSEKVDPKLAFAFLEVAAEKARQKEKSKAIRRGLQRRNASGEELTAPLTVKSTRATTQVIKPGGTSDTKEELKPVARPSVGFARPPSSEIPMAQSSDVVMIDPSQPIHLAPLQAHDTGHDPDDEVSVPTNAMAISAVATERHPDPSRDTKDLDEVEAEPPNESPLESTDTDPQSTVMDSGELRVVTTLKGLTTSCSLFVDERYLGSTPCSLQLPSGRHQLRVERASFKALKKPVTVKANEVTLVRFELQPTFAK